jgi:hypothetical protein
MQEITYPGSITLFIYKVISISPIAFKIAGKLLFALITFILISTTLLKIQYPQKVDQMKRFKWVFSPTAFILLVCAGIFVLRIPNLTLPKLDPDETQWIAASMTYHHGAVLWKSVNGNTGGPLVYVLPTMMWPIGLNYTSIRLFGLLFCVLPSIYLVWKTLQLLFGERPARLSLTILFIFFVSMYNGDCTSYNSEHMAILLTTIAIYLLFSFIKTGSHNLRKLVFLGITLGLVPYAKLQAIPIGICIGALAIFEILRLQNISYKEKAALLFTLFSSALLPSAFCALYLTLHHCWGDFWDYYIMENIRYAGHGIPGYLDPVHGLDKLAILYRMILKRQILLFFIGVHLLVTIVVMMGGFKWQRLRAILFDRIVWWCFLIALSAYIAIIAPGNYYLHYFYFFVFPFALLTGSIVGKIMEGYTMNWRAISSIALFIIISLYTLQVLRQSIWGVSFVATKTGYPLSAVSEAILKYSHRDEQMSIWGIGMDYYVETGLLQGNKCGSAIYAILGAQDDQPVYEEYVEEIKVNKPIVFVDDVGPNSFIINDSKFRHEHFPKLNDYISKNYKEVGEFDGSRLYIANERQREVDSPAFHH